FKKVEGGFINSKGKFEPVAGDVKVSRVMSNREKAEKLAAALEAKKLKGGGETFVTIFPGLDPATVRAVWNTAIDVAQQVIRAGGSVADAIESAIRYIRENVKSEWNEAEARQTLNTAIQSGGS